MANISISELFPTVNFGPTDEFVIVQDNKTVRINGMDVIHGISTMTNLATKSYVDAIAAGAPGALDTLAELAAALNDDANFAANITNLINGKMSTSNFGLEFWNQIATVNTYHIQEGSNLYFTTQRVLDVVTPLIPTSFVTSYNDLTDKPVLFSGSYADLTNKPVFLTDPTFTSVTTTELNVKNITFTGTGAVNITSGNDLNLVAAGQVTVNGNQLVVFGPSGNISMSSEKVAIGNGAGVSAQGYRSISLGYNAGKMSQGDHSIAIGSEAGDVDQPSNTIIINASGVALNGEDRSFRFYIAPIRDTTATTKGLFYNTTTKEVTTATLARVATSGSYNDLTDKPVATGWNTIVNISNDLGPTRIALGRNAGGASDSDGYGGYGAYGGGSSPFAIAIGNSSGRTNQGGAAISIGVATGYINQGSNAIAIGLTAGNTNQGVNSIAIGNGAGKTDQPAGSIVISASGSDLNGNDTGFYVDPIRSATATSYVAYYNPTTKEVTYGPAPTGSGGTDPTFTTVTATDLNVQNVTFTGTGAVTINSNNDLNFVAAGDITFNGVSTIAKNQLMAIVAASIDFADFKARIASL